MKPIIAAPVIFALVYRAYSRKSLTPAGILVAILTSIVHAVHPYSICLALLVVFFLAGTAATKVKHEVKARLTLSSAGTPGGEGPRTSVQVLANSLVASVLILVHTWQLRRESTGDSSQCWRYKTDVLVVGIVANYAAVAADTLSSELGILSPSPPVLITKPWRTCPRGTNGGVTLAGLLAGLAGSSLISGTAVLLLPFCTDWPTSSKARFAAGMALLGLGGSLLDSLLGALLQASVVDSRSGKVVEGEGGRKVRYEDERDAATRTSAKNIAEPGRKVETGRDLLSNNQVNLAMAATISAVGVTTACWVWEISLSRAISI